MRKSTPLLTDVFKKRGGLLTEETSDEWVADNPQCAVKVAQNILKNHGADWDEFLQDNPDQRGKPMVDSQKLVGWLGY